MVDGSNVGGGLGLVAAVAVVSTGIILASYHLHRRLGADPKIDVAEQWRQRRRTRKKKVRFADEVAAGPSSDALEEHRRRRSAAAAGGPLRPALRKA